MHILTHILLICLWLDVVWAQASAPGPSPAQKTNNEDLSELALWPDVDIRGLLAGETNATEKTPSPVDLLFVLQADSATLVPASDGGLLGGHLLLGGVLSQVVAFADRPYRTMDMISLEDFFAFELIQEFFAGPNPPNAIITGELPHDIASQRWNESDWLNRTGDSSEPCWARLPMTCNDRQSFALIFPQAWTYLEKTDVSISSTTRCFKIC